MLQIKKKTAQFFISENLKLSKKQDFVPLYQFINMILTKKIACYCRNNHILPVAFLFIMYNFSHISIFLSFTNSFFLHTDFPTRVFKKKTLQFTGISCGWGRGVTNQERLLLVSVQEMSMWGAALKSQRALPATVTAVKTSATEIPSALCTQGHLIPYLA